MSENRRPAQPAGARRPQQAGARRPQQRPGTAQPRPASANGQRRQPPRRRRRRRRVTGRFIVLIVILAVLALGGGILASVLMNRDGGNEPAPAAVDPNNALLNATDVEADEVLSVGDQGAADISQLLGSEDAVITGLSQDQMIKVENLSITPGLDESWMNILLLGSDARTENESCRTDTMIICSINTRSGEVKLTSILRDVAVDFDDIGQYNGTYRLNAANYFGGPQLAMKTINECFGMNIQYYAMVDFTSFAIIAEKLGGVELTISQEEMEQINLNAKKQAKQAWKAGIDETELAATNVLLETYGENTHLNGRQALAYARIRKIDSDISRAERQRKVLVALMEKVKTRNAQDIMSMAISMFGYIESNLSVDQIISVATSVITSNLAEVDQFRLPVNDSFVQETRREQSMLYDCDWNLNTQQLYSFIYN